ncbi:MAG: hypothetical protein DRN68_06670 [Thaumarchaeota archaeon]|nr:MAG: hypothetical protein DRN68_06670 [Nitrososphaerota archaeon]
MGMKKVLIFVSIAICLLFLTSTASASWWNVNWKYRREITITNVSGGLTDYQILVELNSSNFNFSHAQENGSDIRFVASDDETLLSHWIEVWNSTNQSAKIWVNVSEVAEGVKIFMYYGNENASDASNANATFIRVIDGVVGAWHFDEGGGNTTHDTSGEGNDGLIHGANWSDGKFGNALEFDGVDDYIEIPFSPSLDFGGATELTFCMWVSLNNTGGERYSGRDFQFLLGYDSICDCWNWWIRVDDSWHGLRDVPGNFTPVTNTWTFLCGVYDGSNSYLYVNNGLDKRINVSGVLDDYDTIIAIGRRGGSNKNYWSGLIDEVKILNKSLSKEDISDLYNNYGYTTPNCPNKVLVRKYTEPEPIAIVGEEVSGTFTTASLLMIEREIGANYILWKWSCTNPDALVDVFVDGSEVLSAVSAASGEYLLTDVNENELHIIKIVNSFNASDYVRDEARTLPPFSFFLTLLLTTFVLLIITFATTSTVRVIASIFTLLFTAFAYKYSIYYASPLSYLLLFAFFFTFALMLVEVLRMLTSTIRKKPKWEEDFWSEWREGGGGI